MTSVREHILATMATTLSATPSIGAPVYRSRIVPVARGESPAIIIEPVQDQASQHAIPKVDWQMLVRVSVIVRADVPDQSADTLVSTIYSRLMADLTVGGYAYDVQPQNVAFEYIDADVPAGIIASDFLVLYRTSLTDIAVV